MHNLNKYLKKYWYFAIFGPIFMICEVLMDLFLTDYMEKMVDFGIQTSNLDNVLKYGLIMLGILAAGVTCGVLSGVFVNLTAFNFSNDLRKDLYKKIMSLSLNQTDAYKTGSLITRVTNDISQVQNAVSQVLRGLVRSLSFFILGIVFTLSISKRFGYILLVVLPMEVFLMFLFIKLIFPVFKRIQAKLDKVNTVVHENVDGARVVKAFSKEEYEFNRFKDANDGYTAEHLYVSKIGALLMPLISLIVYAAQIVIYYIGGNSILNAYKGLIGLDEMIMVGEITQANTYIMMVCQSMLMLGMMISMIARAVASITRINEILDSKVELEDGTIDASSISEKGTIEFKNVSFKYSSSKKNVLSNLDFKVNKGDVIAIVGSTGSGKSTLVDLIVRYYDTTEGDVLVDGVNVKDYKKSELRDKISICLQKAELFSGSIKDNIVYGKDGATDEEVELAASISQSKEFIDKKEDGINSEVGEKGSELSGGQKQRVSIARALIKRPEILIFDDSTSALDLVTEAKLHHALKENMPDTTTIIVCQRIATAKSADKIIVLDKGKIDSFDTHENLMKNSVIYQDIYNSQLKREEVF
ncbi:MAG: ABC transporter ATP-binding protein/permease [Gammaproteobacteria bacterium]|nr:ABC transporter ATP-binding protein/permease [Gammaproteobacteria bacterium]